MRTKLSGPSQAKCQSYLPTEQAGIYVLFYNPDFKLITRSQKSLLLSLVSITNLTKLCSFLAFTAKSFTGWMPSRWTTTRKQSHGYWRGIHNTYSMLLSHKRIALNIVNCQHIFSIIMSTYWPTKRCILQLEKKTYWNICCYEITVLYKYNEIILV